MYRVVTIQYLNEGTSRKRVVSRGPLHPNRERAEQWANYLRKLGCYHDVRVESNTQTSSNQLHLHG